MKINHLPLLASSPTNLRELHKLFFTRSLKKVFRKTSVWEKLNEVGIYQMALLSGSTLADGLKRLE